MNRLKALVTLIAFMLIFGFSAIFTLSSLAIIGLIGFLTSLVARFKKIEINEHGFVEKTVN